MIQQEPYLKQEEREEFSLVDLLHIVASRWYWFVLSIVVCCALGALYIKSKPKVYTRTATVLIKDDMAGTGVLSESTAFQELNMFNRKSNVENEVLIFKSKRLMKEVARRLRLDISYKVKVGLRNIELYTQSPTILRFPETAEIESVSLTVQPLNEREVHLSGVVDDTDWQMQAALNDTIDTPAGKVVVTPTHYYTEEYYGVPIVVTKSNLERVAIACSNSLQVALANKMVSIINLSLNDVSRLRAEDILNTLIAVYNEDAINDKNQVAVNTANFINERLIIIENELGDVDTDIETYLKEHQLTDIRSESGVYLQSSTRYQQQALAVENQLTLAQYVHEYLTDPTKSSDLIPANTGISDISASVENQIREYNNILLKRDKLIANSSDRNPVVMDLNNSLVSMKQTIIRAVDNLVAGLKMQLANIQQEEARTTRRISAVPTQQKHVLSIERQQKIKEALYLYLLNKREENALSQSITESNARIVDAATGDNNPVAPRTKVILLAAFCIGCLIPAIIIWLLMALDTKVHNRKDLEDHLTVPFLGEIPLYDKKQKPVGEIVVHENGRDAVSEAFRIVRANMDFMRVKAPAMQVIMFTSFNPDAGKTFVSSNLGMTLALTHKKVVLIDLDIRKGMLSSRGKNPEMGVTNYLSGKTDDLELLIKPAEYHPNLDIIYRGPVPPNPAELLLSDRLDQLIEELRKRYDYIIIDNVPSHIVADAAIVNRVADLTIYVVRAERMDRRLLPEVEKLYTQEKLRNMAVLLNGVQFKRSGYNSYYYGYAYGYGYGYGKK